MLSIYVWHKKILGFGDPECSMMNSHNVNSSGEMEKIDLDNKTKCLGQHVQLN